MSKVNTQRQQAQVKRNLQKAHRAPQLEAKCGQGVHGMMRLGQTIVLVPVKGHQR